MCTIRGRGRRSLEVCCLLERQQSLAERLSRFRRGHSDLTCTGRWQQRASASSCRSHDPVKAAGRRWVPSPSRAPSCRRTCRCPAGCRRRGCGCGGRRFDHLCSRRPCRRHSNPDLRAASPQIHFQSTNSAGGLAAWAPAGASGRSAPCPCPCCARGGEEAEDASANGPDGVAVSASGGGRGHGGRCCGGAVTCGAIGPVGVSARASVTGAVVSAAPTGCVPRPHVDGCCACRGRAVGSALDEDAAVAPAVPALARGRMGCHWCPAKRCPRCRRRHPWPAPPPRRPPAVAVAATTSPVTSRCRTKKERWTTRARLWCRPAKRRRTGMMLPVAVVASPAPWRSSSAAAAAACSLDADQLRSRQSCPCSLEEDEHQLRSPA